MTTPTDYNQHLLAYLQAWQQLLEASAAMTSAAPFAPPGVPTPPMPFAPPMAPPGTTAPGTSPPTDYRAAAVRLPSSVAAAPRAGDRHDAGISTVEGADDHAVRTTDTNGPVGLGAVRFAIIRFAIVRLAIVWLTVVLSDESTKARINRTRTGFRYRSRRHQFSLQNQRNARHQTRIRAFPECRRKARFRVRCEGGFHGLHPVDTSRDPVTFLRSRCGDAVGDGNAGGSRPAPRRAAAGVQVVGGPPGKPTPHFRETRHEERVEHPADRPAIRQRGIVDQSSSFDRRSR